MTNSETRLKALEALKRIEAELVEAHADSDMTDGWVNFIEASFKCVRSALQENMGDASTRGSYSSEVSPATSPICERTDCWLDEKCNGMEGELVEALGNIVDHWSTGGTTQHWLDDLNKATKILDKYRSRKK